MENIPGLVAAIGKFIDHGDKGADKGADAALHTEIGEDGCLIFYQSNDLFRTLLDTGSATRAFGNNNMGYHRLLLLLGDQ